MKVLKKLMMLVFILTLCLTTNALAKDIEVEVNGKALTFDVAPTTISDRTMIPLRATLESLGAEVDWNNATQTATATTKEYTLLVTIGKNTVIKKDNATGTTEDIYMDVVPCVINSRTLVPVRFMAESLNKSVIWDEENQKVIIIDSNYIIDSLKAKAPTFFEYMEKVITGELKQEVNAGKFSFNIKIDKILEDGKHIKLEATVNADVEMKDETFEVHVSVDPKSFKASLDTMMNLMYGGYTNGLSFDFNNMDLNLYYDGKQFFINSSLFKNKDVLELLEIEEDISNGIVYEIPEEERKKINDMLKNGQNFDKEEFLKDFDILMSDLETIDEYEYINVIIDLVGLMMSDDYFIKTADGYKYELNDIQKIVAKYAESIGSDPKEIEDIIKKLNMAMNIKITNDTINNITTKYVAELLINDVTVSFDFNANEEKNASYTFKMPSITKAYRIDY